jgi:PAS domain-containing protein
VDHHLRILRFTPAITKIINLIHSDVGRPVSHILSNLVGYDRLVEDLQAVLDTLLPKEVRVQTRAGAWYLMHILPYRTIDNVIEGAVITFVDITAAEKTQESLREPWADIQTALNQSQAGIAIADAPSGALRYVNEAGRRICGSDRHPLISGVEIDEEVTSWQLTDLDGRSIERDEAPLARAIRFGETCGRELMIDDTRVVLANAAPIRDESGQVTAGIVVFIDVTDRRSQDEAEPEVKEEPQKDVGGAS